MGMVQGALKNRPVFGFYRSIFDQSTINNGPPRLRRTDVRLDGMVENRSLRGISDGEFILGLFKDGTMLLLDRLLAFFRLLDLRLDNFASLAFNRLFCHDGFSCCYYF